MSMSLESKDALDQRKTFVEKIMEEKEKYPPFFKNLID